MGPEPPAVAAWSAGVRDSTVSLVVEQPRLQMTFHGGQGTVNDTPTLMFPKNSYTQAELRSVLFTLQLRIEKYLKDTDQFSAPKKQGV